MRIVNQSWELISPTMEHTADIPLLIEKAARTCYKSEDKICPGSAEKMIDKLIVRGHEAMLEHGAITIKVITDRGVTHEWVRHRLAAYAQESTRYCNYSQDKFGNEITFIKPVFWQENCREMLHWKAAMSRCEESYLQLIELGASPQEARAVLPNSLKTEIYCTMNMREWRHFFRMRDAKPAHPQMRELAHSIHEKFHEIWPCLFTGKESG